MKNYSIRVNNGKQFAGIHRAIKEVFGGGGFIKDEVKLRDGWDTMYHIECNDDTEFFELSLEVRGKEIEYSRELITLGDLEKQGAIN